jgi:hypothetical protein
MANAIEDWNHTPAGDRPVRADKHDFDAEPRRIVGRVHQILDFFQALQ